MGSDYEVGYGRPPKHSQFKKGESGNPSGRPKRSKNFKTDLAEELAEEIFIREGDVEQKVTKQRAVVKTLVAAAASGDPKSLGILTSVYCKAFDIRGAAESETPELSRDEREILDNYAERILRADRLGQSSAKTGD